MKKLVMFLFVGLISYTMAAQDKKAKIEFKEETIDYGKISKGSNGVRVFEFTNTGDAPLVISKAYSSCGCTVPSWPKEPIAPGKKGKIEIKYDTNRPGPIRKTITVITNTDKKSVALKIKGTVATDNSSR
ncbi:DUF1573 domain-containing protein [Zhouia spongiae]|uniref:DUF1573 domain-containing protein n=1 Tax=Zhouia spongiae TaxID=2202721 RepID=A0ABY3YN73_9FLAO|nr:DUF1573 domain-containing protein [Zhouia spongiae]UNY98994.1 DUF1573 domain-containing protein [Zhouia spongiae]